MATAINPMSIAKIINKQVGADEHGARRAELAPPLNYLMMAACRGTNIATLLPEADSAARTGRSAAVAAAAAKAVQLFRSTGSGLVIRAYLVMRGVPSKMSTHRARAVLFSLLMAFALAPRTTTTIGSGGGVVVMAQTAAAAPGADRKLDRPWFNLERTEVAGGAELLTVFGNLQGLAPRGSAGGEFDVPLVSVLRDTLGDAEEENDRLRYVWMLTYTRPSLAQRVTSAIPFFYSRIGNKKRASRTTAPPAVMDLAHPQKDVWERFLWLALQNIFVNPYSIAAKSSTRTFSRNAQDYRTANIIRALAILSLYEAETGAESVFSPADMREIQARLMLAEKTFGGIVDDGYLQRIYHNQNTAWLDTRGHNWELLRQRAESESLHFEPLQLPDGSATHALVWVAKHDLERNRGRAFNARFLNIARPWGDKRLDRWEGYTETRYFDADNRPAVDAVAAATAGGRAVEMIPLALYGLDHPKIPTLLVDFRDGVNPKQREMSRRVIEDVARNLLALSRFGDLHYFLGRTIFDFVTGRRGIDVNQPTRLRAYSQLKLLLSLSESLDPEFRDEISRRLERVSLNPLENDLQAEARLARDQYAALLDYARRPGGLTARLDRDRRAELVPLAHGRAHRILFRFAQILSFNAYTHREKASPEKQRAALDTERRLTYHRRFLREVSKSSPLIEVVWNMDDVRRSLRYIAEHGAGADARMAATTARIFALTQDRETQRLSLNCLYRINNEMAKKELLHIHQNPAVESSLRMLSAEYLRLAVSEEQRIAPADAKAIVSVVGQ